MHRKPGRQKVRLNQTGDNQEFATCAVFVDDIVVTGDDTEKLDELRDLFIEKFKGDTHQWEPINSLLGMDITYASGKLTMNVKAKIEDLFNKYSFLKQLNNGKASKEATSTHRTQRLWTVHLKQTIRT